MLPSSVVRDSAGVRIVEYPGLSPMPPAWAADLNPFRSRLADLPPALRIESQPFLDLGGLRTNEQEEFDASHPFLSATALSDGTIVVNDRSALKFFTADGEFIRAAGRRGRGPGEFQQTRNVCRLPGDTLLVIDYAGGRASLWNSNGDHIQTFASVGRARSGTCDATGARVILDASVATTTNGRGDVVGAHRLIRPDGSLVQQLGMLPTARVAGGLARDPSILPVGNELYVGNARAWEVHVQSLDGRVKRITRLTGALVPITDEAWQAHAAAMIPRSATAEHRKILAEYTASKPFETFPAFSTVRVDPLGRTWIMDFESPASWTVLDTAGVIMGRFEVPGGGLGVRSLLAGLAADHVVLLQDDANGAVHLRFYRYVKE